MAQVIINHLHNLASELKLGDVFKAMNFLMDSHDDQIRSDVENILVAYQPSNNLEKLIRVRLIDRYKCYNEVLNILKSDDAFCITYALQCSWFFKKFDLDVQYFVDSVIPCMSYATRLKVLKKYSKLLKNAQTAVRFFDCLKQRYGLNTALTLLPACDEMFVRNTLDTINVNVPITVLTALFAVHPSIIISYLSRLLESSSANKRVSRTFSVFSFEKIFLLIASKDPHTFALLMEKYHKSIPYLKLGKRSTKQFVNVAFESIKRKPVIYSRIFNWKLVISYLSLEQISDLQLAMFPKTVSDFFQAHSGYCDFVNLTSSLKEPIKGEMLVSNFQKAYEKSLTEYLNVIDLSLAVKLPKEIKDNWVESKLMESDSANEKMKYIIHLPSQKSLPMLKKLMEVEGEVRVRSEIVNCMFQTVEINNDENLIKDICDYVVKRFRNDRNIIKENVVTKLSGYKRLIEISDECWKSIEEIINIMMVKNEINGCLHEIIDILSIQIHSRLKRNLPIDVQFDKLLKISDGQYTYNLCIYTPYEKQCLKLFLNDFQKRNLCKMNKMANENDENYMLPEKLLTRLSQWNARHKNDRIDLPDWLKKMIENLFTRDDCNYKKVTVLEALKKDQKLKKEIYEKIFPNYLDPSIITYKLHNDPVLVADVTSDIMKKILKESVASYQPFFKQAKLYPALKILDIIADYCINVLQEKCDDENSLLCVKKNSIRVLSFMLPTKKFVEIISGFYPRGSTIDDFSDEGRELFQIQSEIAASLKCVDSPSEIIESLSKFAVGDYLKLVVGSLNSICLKTPEHKILPLLKQWLDCPISLRKHFFRAYFRIAPISNTLEMLVGIFESEKNQSLRMLLFDHAQRYFFKEPSSESFNILKAVINKFQSSDEAIINKLLVIENVPDEFISEYLQILWDKASLKSKACIMQSRCDIIDYIDPDVLRLLNEEFCDALLSEVFLQSHLNLKSFAVKYLLYSENLDQLGKRFEKLIFEIEKLLKKWNDFELKAENVFQSRCTIYFLVSSLVRESFNSSEKSLPPHNILKKLKDTLLNYLQENDIVMELILLDLAIGFHGASSNSEMMYNFSKFIEPVVLLMVERYGNAIIGSISSCLEKILAWNFSSEDLKRNQIQLSEILLLSSASNFCFILGIKLLPSVVTSDIPKYKQLLSVILQNSDPLVKLYASNLFKKLNSSVTVE